MQDKEKIIVNDYINNDPLSEENLDKTLNFLHEIRLLCPNKTIWLYSGFTIEECKPFDENTILKPSEFAPNLQKLLKKRWEVIKNVDIFVDGRYIDSQRNIQLMWRGSKNQRIIDIKESLKHDKVVLYCD